MFTLGVIIGAIVFGCVGFVAGKVYGSGVMKKAIEQGKVIIDGLKEDVKDIG